MESVKSRWTLSLRGETVNNLLEKTFIAPKGILMESILRRADSSVAGSGDPPPVLLRTIKRTILPFSAGSDVVQTTPPRSNPDAGQSDIRLSAELHDILRDRALSAVFQPIIRLDSGIVAAYEGLIRGPENHPLHSPCDLFSAARRFNRSDELEKLCRQVILSKYAALKVPGKIFLNISPEQLIEPQAELDARLGYLAQIGISPERIVLELTENQATFDYDLMRAAVERCREHGFQIAIDDLGEGFSSLRLWSEIRPDYVKIDMHFIQGIERDPVKLQFVQSIQLIAGKSGTTTIAEGIETKEQLLLLQELGVACGQGYHIERPTPNPTGSIPADLAQSLQQNIALVHSSNERSTNLSTALKLLRIVPVVPPEKQANDVYAIFASDPAIQIIAVVVQGIPIGSISRVSMIDRFARPYQRELFGKRSCTLFMSPEPLVFDKNTGLQELGMAIADADPHHLSNGFAITDQGKYIGMGTGHDVMREITQMQISAARYANPLTQLPGNVPINEEIDRMILSGRQFVACYCDIDNFKPFNDVHGYRRGDDVIQATAAILAEQCAPSHDFLGHIGGDDFIILFQSQDWESRCHSVLARFSEVAVGYHSQADIERGGYVGEDRQGNKVIHPSLSLSLGAVRIEPGHGKSNYQIAAAATEAKRQAKAVPGNSFFIERRHAF